MNSNSSSSISPVNTTVILNDFGDRDFKFTKHDLKRYLKLRIVMGMLRNFCEEPDGSAKPSNEQIVRSIKTFMVKNHFQNINIPDFIQTNNSDLQLSYPEQKVIGEYIPAQIEKSYKDSIDAIHTIKTKHPDFLNATILPEKKLIDLESTRQQLYKDLVTLQLRKFKMLVNLLEVRLSPKIEHQVRILLHEFELFHLKAEVLYSYLEHHAMKQSKYAVTAFKQIEKTIDQLLKEKMKLNG